MNPNVFVGQRAGYSNTTGSQNTAFGYQALYQKPLDPHKNLIDAVSRIDQILQISNVLEISNEIPAVADAYAEFRQAIDRFNLVLVLTKK